MTIGWTDTAGATVDTTRPYLVRFESGVSIAVFFYNGPISRAIAFEGLLNSGENFAARLKGGFKDGAQPQLVHVATDGESYGHHHKYGEMALAYALRLLEQDKTVKLTNYGSFLEQFPPEYEARDCGEHLVELRARSGALALELRLQRGQAGIQPAVARAAAAGAGRAARRRGSAHRAGRRQAFQRCVGRARRLYPGDSRPRRGVRWSASSARIRATR